MQILIDNIRSASNIGSVFRTCDAFGIDKIYICGISATPPNKEILKTALGATETVAWEYHPDAQVLMQQLKADSSNWMIAIEQGDTSISLQSFVTPSDKNPIFILGNEVEGVSAELLRLADALVEIPQFGKKKSLNVSVAAGIVLWDQLSKTRLNKPTP
ncbi:MAG: TrmH family RNA methyltransferase [Bacteroidia bacterium]|jgi:tRNA G18 (ribose-2'-O)-methylase SpoU